MAERDILKEAQEWYERTTRLMSAEWLDKHMAKPEALYVGYLLETVRELTDRVRAADQQRGKDA